MQEHYGLTHSWVVIMQLLNQQDQILLVSPSVILVLSLSLSHRACMMRFTAKGICPTGYTAMWCLQNVIPSSPIVHLNQIHQLELATGSSHQDAHFYQLETLYRNLGYTDMFHKVSFLSAKLILLHLQMCIVI